MDCFFRICGSCFLRLNNYYNDLSKEVSVTASDCSRWLWLALLLTEGIVLILNPDLVIHYLSRRAGCQGPVTYAY